ncbi:rhomboid family intramembrane serine protease [bacterium]|nr:rhomboid family intramembrane serine protease [bacterium]
MKKGRYPHGVIWGCRQCGGRAVTLNLLRKSIERDAIERIWRRAESGAGVEGKSCPSCTRRMAQFKPNLPGVDWKLDCCKPCRMFWFDAGEFEDLPGIPPPPPETNPIHSVPETILVQASEAQRNNQDAGSHSYISEENLRLIPAIFLLPVEYDTNPLRHWPWLTWLIFITLIAVFVESLSNLETIVNEYGFIPLNAFRLAGMTLITSFFLHGSLVHLLGNAYFLLIFGDNVEDFIGKRLFGLLLFVSTLFGSLTHCLFDPRPDLPCIGASAGISGILVFYAMQFPRIRVGILLYFKWLRIPIATALVGWILIQCLGTLYQISGSSKMSALAHLGGAAAGLFFWSIFNYYHHRQTSLYQKT